MLQTKDVYFSYTSGVSFHFPDIDCAAGETVLITGSSGKGKTTLLHLLAGILKPSAGEILVGQTNMAEMSGKRLDSFRGKRIGIIFQQSHFIQSLPVQDNLVMPLYCSRQPILYKEAGELAAQLGIQHLLKKKSTELSQGEQQRLSIARAVIHRPKLLLADEPTSSLDDGNCEKVIDLLLEQTATCKAALVIVTHDQRVKQKITNAIHLS
jgi:ABC-type lipoprotein export system ATPase subunit